MVQAIDFMISYNEVAISYLVKVDVLWDAYHSIHFFLGNIGRSLVQAGFETKASCTIVLQGHLHHSIQLIQDIIGCRSVFWGKD